MKSFKLPFAMKYLFRTDFKSGDHYPTQDNGNLTQNDNTIWKTSIKQQPLKNVVFSLFEVMHLWQLEGINGLTKAPPEFVPPFATMSPRQGGVVEREVSCVSLIFSKNKAKRRNNSEMQQILSYYTTYTDNRFNQFGGGWGAGV